MSSENYAVLAYVISLALLFGYGISVWVAQRLHDRRGPRHGAKS